MQGRLIYLIGPSGAGKDSLLEAAREALAARQVRIARRVITRSAEAVGEAAHPVTLAEFERLEAEQAFAFRHRDEEALCIVAGHLALSMTLAGQERDRPESEVETEEPAPVDAIPSATGPLRIRFYPRDGSIFINNDYLIRGVPGRLLKHFVEEYAQSGRQDFLNREIRRDRNLQLPDFKDNLETRLILLRRRLEEKGGPIRLGRAERGHIRFEIEGMPELVVVEE